MIVILKGVLAVFISKIPIIFGLQPITLIGFISLLFFDYILDLITCYKINSNICFKPNTIKFVFNLFFYLFIFAIVFSFTHQFPIIFLNIFNTITVIFILDNLINVFNALSTITNESAFGEILSYLNKTIKIYKNKSQETIKENIDGERKSDSNV
jgi:uncharacterized protein YihD (DUF1040 family)